MTSKGRPENSLLEAELEYDKMTRVAPAVTIETTEELGTVRCSGRTCQVFQSHHDHIYFLMHHPKTITRRIQDQLWDDPVRKYELFFQLLGRSRPSPFVGFIVFIWQIID